MLRLTFWRVVIVVFVIVVAVTVLLLAFDLGSQVPTPMEEIVDPTIP